MRTKLSIAAAIAMICASTGAQAITRTFTGSATFTDGGPVTAAGFTFGITYDPNGGNFFNKAVNYYTTTAGYAAFNPSTVTFALQGQSIYINGTSYGLAYYYPDFQLTIFPRGEGLPLNFIVSYTVGDNTASHDTQLTSLTETTAATGVPEASTWAMMVVGIGGLGIAMRRRQQPALRAA